MPDQSEEQFMQRRLLLASVLSAVAMMGYFYVGSLNAPPRPDPASTPAVVDQANPPAADEGAAEKKSAETPTENAGSSEAASESGAEPTAEPAEPADAEPAPGVVAADAEQEIVIESETYRVTFTNRGALVKSWILKNYEDSIGEPLDLVHGSGAEQYGYPFELTLPGGEDLTELNQALFVAGEGAASRTAPAELTFKYANNGWSARKTFRFESRGYQLQIETEVRQRGEPRPHLIAWPGGFGDTAHVNAGRNYSQTFYYDAASAKPVRNKADDAEEQRISNTGPYPFAGIDDVFFVAVFEPPSEQSLTLETWAVKILPEGVAVPEGADQAAVDDLKQSFAAAAVGGSADNAFEVFLGPKSIPVLAAISERHRQIVDFGFLSFLALPLFYMLLWTHENVVANYGWAIVLVTVVINLVLFPLKWKSTKSMKRMQALQPLIKQINEKYKGLSMRDPKKAQQNEEMMALYKKYGVNPMGGCLPMVLQMPFFIAFYWVLTSAIEMRHASWLWVADLSQPETIAIRVLPIAMVLSQFWQQAMTPQPTVDPAQARLMKFMPLMFGVFLYGFQSGLVLYWLTMNLVGVAQQALLNRLPSEPLEIEQPRRRKKKK